MSIVLNWFKKELKFLGESIPEIFKGFIFFLLMFSGLGVAIILRISGYNGAVIALVAVFVEGLATIFCYLIFRKYLKSQEDKKPLEKTKKTKSEIAK